MQPNLKDLFLSFEKRRNMHQDPKRRIAARALQLIGPGDEVFLGAGTTASLLAEELGESPTHFMLRIWTNNLFAVNLWLRRHEKVFSENFVGMVGGEVSRKNLSVVNLVAPFSQVDKAIIGTPGLSLKGLTADDTDTVQQLEFLAKRAKNIIILADSTKIGRDCAYPTRSMRMIRLDISHQKSYTLVTDSDGKGAPERDHVLSRLEEIGFRVIQV